MGKAKFSSTTRHLVTCEECGPLASDTIIPAESEAFPLAYKHAATNAHKVTVVSTVTTLISGYVDVDGDGTRHD